MRGEQDSSIGLPIARCCGKLLSSCTCAWEQRKRVLKQQVMGGNNGPKPQQAQPTIVSSEAKTQQFIPRLKKES